MTYTTITGDMWDMISAKVYGTAAHARELLKANPDKLETYVFGPGEEIQVPEIYEKKVKTSQLPWKR